MSKVVSRNRRKSYGPPAQSLEQQWAKDRNFAKFRLSGTKVNFENLLAGFLLTQDEYADVKSVVTTIEAVLYRWDGRNEKSKAAYLRMRGTSKK